MTFRLIGSGLFPVLLFSILALNSNAAEKTAGKIAWKETYSQAFYAAKKAKKPILVHIGADWCPGCHQMLDHTYTDPNLVKRVNSDFLSVKLDVDVDVDLVAKIGGVNVYPTTVIISPEMKIVKRLGGYLSPAELNRHLKAEIAKKKPAGVATASMT